MNIAPAPPLTPVRLAWAVCSGLSALFVGLGLSRFGYTPLVPVLIGEGWLDPAEAVYAGSANLAGYLIGAIAIAQLRRREAERVLTRAALLACTVSFAACAYPLGFAWFTGWRGLSGIAGAVLMVLTPPRVLAVAPVRWRGRIGGIMFLGVGLGIALSALITPVILRLGLPLTWWGLAALSAVLTAFAWWGFPGAPSSAEPAGESLASSVAPSPAPPSAAPAVAAPALRRGLMLIVSAYSLSAMGYVPHTVFWVDFIARGLGAGLGAGAANWVLFGLGATAAPLLLGMLADRIGFAAAFRASLVVNALVVGLPLVSTASWCLVLSSLGVGGFISGCTSLASSRLTGLLPAHERRRVWGWMTTGFSVFYAVGGYGSSYLFARTGSYDLLFGIGAVTMLVAAGLDLLAAGRSGARP